jgi:hypothetical protein
MMLKTKAMGDVAAAAPRSRLAAAALAGALALANCHSQVHAEPPPGSIEVTRYLKEAPAGLAEMNDEPGNEMPLHGLLADCRGKSACTLPLHEGDMLLSVKFRPEEGGNLEVTVNRIAEEGVVFQGRTDYNMVDAKYDYQLIRFGTSAALFSTNLKVRVQKADNGTYFISVD